MPPKASEPDQQLAKRKRSVAVTGQPSASRKPPQPRKPSPSKLARAAAKPARKRVRNVAEAGGVIVSGRDGLWVHAVNRQCHRRRRDALAMLVWDLDCDGSGDAFRQ